VEFLQPVLDVAPLPVDLVHAPGSLGQVGDDKARVVPRVPAGEPDDLGLHDHAPLAVPGLGGVAGLAKDLGAPAGGLAAHPGPAEQAPDALLEAGVARHGHQVFDTLLLQEGEDGRRGEAAVQPDPESRVGERGAELAEQPAQHPEGARRRRGVPRSEDGRD